MPNKQGWFEPKNDKGVSPLHQKAALKGKGKDISNAEIKPHPGRCADKAVEKFDEWNPNEETVEDLIVLINNLEECPDYEKDDFYELETRLSVADGYEEFADDYIELPLWTVDHEGNALIGEDAGTIKHVNEIDEDYFAMHGFSAEELIEIQEAVDAKMLENEPFDEMRGKIYQFDDNTQWLIFKDYDTAEYEAKKYVREMLENEPEMFSKEWLQNYIIMSDADKRMFADQDATNYAYDQLSEDEAMEKAGSDEKYDEFQESIDSLESEVKDLEEVKAELESTIEEMEDTDSDIISKVTDIESAISAKFDEVHILEKKQEALPDEAREKIQEDKYDEIYEELDDPIQYFVEDQGIYTIEELMDSTIVSINIDEAARNAVDDDGIAHFFATYDGNEIGTDSGMMMYRTN